MGTQWKVEHSRITESKISATAVQGTRVEARGPIEKWLWWSRSDRRVAQARVITVIKGRVTRFEMQWESRAHRIC